MVHFGSFPAPAWAQGTPEASAESVPYAPTFGSIVGRPTPARADALARLAFRLDSSRPAPARAAKRQRRAQRPKLAALQSSSDMRARCAFNQRCAFRSTRHTCVRQVTEAPARGVRSQQSVQQAFDALSSGHKVSRAD